MRSTVGKWRRIDSAGDQVIGAAFNNIGLEIRVTDLQTIIYHSNNNAFTGNTRGDGITDIHVFTGHTAILGKGILACVFQMPLMLIQRVATVDTQCQR
ncbi:hypothetical protein [Shewanella algae]|uniref:hypothetical protein n=1 Tax=Shewanella algae TaxID=38313 RepID=UPI00351D6C7B